MKRTAITVLVTLLVIFGIYRFGFSKGWGERDAEMQAEIAQKNSEAREKERALNEKLNQNATALQEANDVITEKQTALTRAINSGRVRLNTSCVPTSAGATPAPVGGDTTASESDRETLRLIAEIVAQGDRNTEQLNACIAAYNQVMESVNGQR